MRLWVDDLRECPEYGAAYGAWAWAKTSHEAICCLKWWTKVEEMSLDHDLGGDDTTRPIVLWLCEQYAEGNNYWPDKVVVHSANPPGRIWLEGMIERYKP